MSRQLVNLKDNDNILVPKVLAGIDTNNVIYSATTNTYTATQDCYVVLYSTESSWESRPKISIDNVEIMYKSTSNTNSTKTIILLKNEQVLKVVTYSTNVNTLTVYGLKY